MGHDYGDELLGNDAQFRAFLTENQVEWLSQEESEALIETYGLGFDEPDSSY
jgi:hypothetical protein